MARKLIVEIVGDSRQLERSFARSEKAARDFNQTAERSGKSMSVLGAGAKFAAGYIGVQGLAGAAQAAFQEMENAAQVSAQTAAALKSTGGVANVTAKQIDELAQSILQKTGIDDEATKSAENQLLAFTRIRNEVGKGNDIFDQATKAVADLATRMNRGAVPSAEQMQAASVRLGKALNDPIKGLGALARVGIQFTDEQKRQIKALVDSGQTMRAQQLILDELTRKFGGAADAAGKTLPGQIAILKESLLNLGGSIAGQVVPDIMLGVGALTKMVGALQDVHAWSKKSGGGLEGFAKKAVKSAMDNAKWLASPGYLPLLAGYEAYKKLRPGPGPGAPLGAGTPADMRSQLAPLVPAGLWLKPPAPKQLDTVEQAGRKAGQAIRKAWAKGATSKQAQAQLAAGARYTQLRNTWFDQMISRQLGRVGDVGPAGQLERLRKIAREIQAALAGTHDRTRRLNLADQLLDINKQERDIQGQITDNIKQGNQALRDRADAIKSAVLANLGLKQQSLEDKQQLQDATKALRLARAIGGPMGIQAAQRSVQQAQYAVLRDRLEGAPATLKGGQFAYAGITVNVNGVSDPEKVARQVVAVLERRRRHTSVPQRGPTVDTSAPK